MDGGRDFSTDVLVQILQGLTPIPRRRLRLVCRHWRDAIDDAYAGDREVQKRAPKPLFLSYIHSSGRHCTARAYVVDDLAGGSFREVWSSSAVPHQGGIGIIGTCNGILCLSENLKPGGAVTLVNPATGETLAVPPLPYFSGQPRYGIAIHRWHELYSFLYHHMTGQYKIVHVPCYLDRTCEFDVVQVFTLGEASWTDVPGPQSSCDVGSGLVSISGVLYWVTKSTEKVMSFDLEDERVTHINSLPVPAVSGYSCRLTVLSGALGADGSTEHGAAASIRKKSGDAYLGAVDGSAKARGACMPALYVALLVSTAMESSVHLGVSGDGGSGDGLWA